MQKKFLFLLLLFFPTTIFASYLNQANGVYFNHQEDLTYTDPYRGSLRIGADFEGIMIEAIQKARHRAYVAVQEINTPFLAQAMVQAKRRGVDVRLILEDNYNFDISSILTFERVPPEVLALMDPYAQRKILSQLTFLDINGDGRINSHELNTRDALTIVRRGGVPIIDDTFDGSKGSGLMHHKFIIIDDDLVVVTSANFTRSDIHGDYHEPSSVGNANALMYFYSQEMVQSFEEEFKIMWGNGQMGTGTFGVQKAFRMPKTKRLGWDMDVTLQFSPTSKRIPWTLSTNGTIYQHLAQAQDSVWMALFVFSEQHFSNALLPLFKKGGDIRLLIDRSFATRYYSELLDMWGLARVWHRDGLCFYQRANNPWPGSIQYGGVPQLQPTDKLHHKFAVVDSSSVIFGSHNWSISANEINDETLMIIQSKRIAEAFEQEHLRLQRVSRFGPPATLLRQIAYDEENCDEIHMETEPTRTYY